MKSSFLLSLVLLGTTLYAQTRSEFYHIPETRIYENSIRNTRQPDNTVTTSTSASVSAVQVEDTVSKRSLLDFYIPSALFTFNVEPASISRVTLAATDTKFSFKYGFRFKKAVDEPGEKRTLGSGLGFAFSSKLTDGAKTLFTPDDVSKEYSLKVIWTNVLRDKFYVSTKKQADFTSSHAQWLNVNLNGDIVQKNVFTNDTAYTKHNNLNVQLLVTFNNLFNSFLGRYVYQRNIFNVGAGYGSFDNFESLSKYTLRRSVVNATGRYVGETSNVVGRRITDKTNFQRMDGFIGVASVFYPLTPPDKLTTLIFGGNATMFGLGTSDYLANLNAGFFLSQRVFKDDKLTENFSFGVLAAWNQFQNRHQMDYAKDNFSIILTAQIPISFQ